MRIALLVLIAAVSLSGSAAGRGTLRLYNESERPVIVYFKARSSQQWATTTIQSNGRFAFREPDGEDFDLTVQWFRSDGDVTESRLLPPDPAVPFVEAPKNFAYPMRFDFRDNGIWRRRDGAWVLDKPTNQESHCGIWGAGWNDQHYLILSAPCEPDIAFDLKKPHVPRPKKGATASY